MNYGEGMKGKALSAAVLILFLSNNKIKKLYKIKDTSKIKFFWTRMKKASKRNEEGMKKTIKMHEEGIKKASKMHEDGISNRYYSKFVGNYTFPRYTNHT